MEYVLRIIGVLAIVAGLFLGVRVVMQLQANGLPLQNAMVAGAVGGAAGIAVTGILFMAFGTVIEVLKDIRRNTARAGYDPSA
jgi:hypothetical protein